VTDGMKDRPLSSNEISWGDKVYDDKLAVNWEQLKILEE
jgi:hypothetical protein